MTRERAKELLPIIQAYAEGKDVQVFDGCQWHDLSKPSPAFEGLEYRIKPEPKLRPWKPEEVPVGALIRHKATWSGIRMMIVCAWNNGIKAHDSGDGIQLSFGGALESYEHSTDGGKTYLPCGILES
jgi:hypothetical protein